MFYLATKIKQFTNIVIPCLLQFDVKPYSSLNIKKKTMPQLMYTMETNTISALKGTFAKSLNVPE